MVLTGGGGKGAMVLVKAANCKLNVVGSDVGLSVANAVEKKG